MPRHLRSPIQPEKNETDNYLLAVIGPKMELYLFYGLWLWRDSYLFLWSPTGSVKIYSEVLKLSVCVCVWGGGV